MVATNPQERLAELRNMKRLAELRAMRDSAVGASTSPQIGTAEDMVKWNVVISVSYTHLTLPTKRIV